MLATSGRGLGRENCGAGDSSAGAEPCTDGGCAGADEWTDEDSGEGTSAAAAAVGHSAGAGSAESRGGQDFGSSSYLVQGSYPVYEEICTLPWE